MSRTIRPRNLDVTKKLQIRRVQDVIFKEGDKTFSASSVSKGTVREVASKKAFIPTPQTQKVSSEFDVKREFKRSVNYIHFTNCTGAKVITEHDQYDLLQDDLEWLRDYNLQNPKERHPLNEDAMESLIDLFEKQAWLVTKKVDPSQEYPLAQAQLDAQENLNLRGKHVQEVYGYWKVKRMKLDKALMRKFQQAPPHEDNNPHVAFRLRVPETGRRVSYRNPKKNDHGGYQKMRVLRKDFDRLMEIIEQTREREFLKKDSHLIDTDIFNKRLESALSSRVKGEAQIKKLLISTIPKCPAQRKVIETQRRKRDKTHTRKPKFRSREKTPQSPQIQDISDDDAFSETDDSDREFYENVENMLLETKMRNEGLSPRKLIPEIGFPAPHWVPGYEEILDKEIPPFNGDKSPMKKSDSLTRMELEGSTENSVQSTEQYAPTHQSYHRHRGRFCGHIGRGGRLFLMLKVRGRGRGRGSELSEFNDDDLEDLNDDELDLNF